MTISRLKYFLIVLLFLPTFLFSQVKLNSFGKGIVFQAKDTSFYCKMNFRIQNLIYNEWSGENNTFSEFNSNSRIRRSRLKFSGWAVDPKIEYKIEVSFSNNDTGGGSGIEFNKTSNLLLDATVSYNFFRNLEIKLGQTKLAGNRERVISSADLQFVDRSRLNSRFNIDRDFGIFLLNKHQISSSFILKESVSMSQGEGRDVTIGYNGGYCYTFRVDALPFGKFKSKGDYVSSAIAYEETPKLNIGATYSVNNNSVRERGQLGNFILDNGQYLGKTTNVFFADLMYKYKNLSILSEYANKWAIDNQPIIFNDNGTIIGKLYTGEAFNIQAGYMLGKNWEAAIRYTTVNPTPSIAEKNTEYTIGINKFIKGHKLKIQTDFTYSDLDISSDYIFWRTQVEFQF